MYEKDQHNTSFKEYHEIRQSSVLLILKLVGIELGMLLLHFLAGKLLTMTNMHGTEVGGITLEVWELVLFHVTNSVLLLSVILSWLYTYYTISGFSLSKVKGIIKKERQSFDLSGVQEIRVTQNFLAQIGNYGTLWLENPLIGKNIMLENIGDPHVYSKYLNQQCRKSKENITDPVLAPAPSKKT